MQRRDFHFDLPQDLIAAHPPAQRRDSRLLHLQRANGTLYDRRFGDFPTLLRQGDLLVFNDTKVIPARLHGYKTDSGGKLEVLVERVLSPQRVAAHVRAAKSPKPGTRLTLEEKVKAVAGERHGDLFEITFEDCDDVYALLEKYGHIPLPPYIRRDSTHTDRKRYQTVYADKPGAVAAPTAGLHFDREMLDSLERDGIEKAFVTLHVGAGTFQPVRVDDLEKHHMHAEWLELAPSVCNQIEATRARGGRIIAVGTTSVRVLESAAQSGKLRPMCGDTRLFIKPGYTFHCVDAMLTNFHLPESTLLMLVSAFAGRDKVLAAYQHAVTQKYRFFSYGDAMFID